MAILSTLLSVAVPTGMWESIIWAFEGFTKNYVWAVVLLTVIIRLVWAPLDTYNRRMSVKNAEVQAKMQPELQKIQEKYGQNKQVLNQKTNEVYKKYNFNIMGSCGFMLIFLVLNLVIFFTLFAGLNSIASYKIYANYENLKTNYANCLYLTDQNLSAYKTYISGESEYLFKTFVDAQGKTQIGFYEKNGQEPLFSGEYLGLDKLAELDEEVADGEQKQANDVINAIITKFQEDVLQEEVKDGEIVVTEKITLFDKVLTSAMPLIEDQYNTNKEKFLWIENIWVADSPFKTSIFDFNQFAGSVRSGIETGEETIYNSFMARLSQSQSRINGYFILPLLTIAVSFLSMWLSNWLNNRGKKGVKQGKLMAIIMPIIMGIFAILYNAVFAIYMLTSQIISTALLPLEQWIVKKWNNASEKKRLQKQENVVDYRRK